MQGFSVRESGIEPFAKQKEKSSKFLLLFCHFKNPYGCVFFAESVFLFEKNSRDWNESEKVKAICLILSKKGDTIKS